jgi:hypothetical protein
MNNHAAVYDSCTSQLARPLSYKTTAAEAIKVEGLVACWQPSAAARKQSTASFLTLHSWARDSSLVRTVSCLSPLYTALQPNHRKLMASPNPNQHRDGPGNTKIELEQRPFLSTLTRN